MPRKHKRVLGSRPYANWSNDTLNKAIEEVKSGVLTLRGAEEKYKIPKSTIQRKNKGLNMGKIGRPTELDSEEENCLIQALIVLSEWGTPFTTLELRLLVKAYLDAKGQTSQRFASNMPGVEWCYSFLERHKTKLSHRLYANITGLIWSQVIVDILKETRQKDAGSVKIRRSKLNIKPGESVTENHFNQGPSTSAREIVICSRDKDSDTDNTDNDPMTYVDPLLCSRDQDSDTDDDYIPPRDSLLKNVVENISADLHNVNENKENNNPLLMDAVEHSMLENISEDLHKMNNDDKENLVGNRILQYRENDFILLKLDYNINLKKMITKFFIAKVKQVTSTNYILCKFMRASTKTKHTFIFPEVDDEMVIEEKQIVRKLLPPEIRRGRHLFKDIDGVTF